MAMIGARRLPFVLGDNAQPPLMSDAPGTGAWGQSQGQTDAIYGGVASPVAPPVEPKHGFAGYLDRLINPDINTTGGKLVMLSQAVGKQFGSPLAAATDNIQQQRRNSLLEQLKLAEFNKPEYRSGPGGSIYGIGRDGQANQVVAGVPEKTNTEKTADYLRSVNPAYADTYLQGVSNPMQMVLSDNGDGTKTPAWLPKAGPAPVASQGPPATAINYLKQHPDQATAFNAKYGEGAAARALGGAVPSGTATFR